MQTVQNLKVGNVWSTGSFLHIEQGRDTVLHLPNVLQARFDGTTGPIGKLSESDKILEELDARMAGGKCPITCPKQFMWLWYVCSKKQKHALMQPIMGQVYRKFSWGDVID